MKKVGLIGGMSWESTVTYYQQINEAVKERMGGLHSAECIIYSLDFDPIEKLQSQDRWEEAGEILLEAAQALENAGADYIFICANTMHKVCDQVQKGIHTPIVHIAQVTADAIKSKGLHKVGLIGTKYTVVGDFYLGKLAENGLETIVSGPDRIEEINRIIYEELCLGILREESRELLLDEIRALEMQGAEGIILGCTEIGLLVHPEDTDIPQFDTALLHAQAAAELCMKE